MSKHLTDPTIHPSWHHRDTYVEFEFPARPNHAGLSSSGRSESCTGACGETAYKHIGYEYCDIDCACQSSTGTGLPLRSHPLAERPVPVGHLTLVDRIKRAAEKLDDLEEDCA